MTSGEKIRRARRNAGLTQKELGRRLRMSQQQIAQYENGERQAKPSTLNRIGAALNVDPNQLCDDFNFNTVVKAIMKAMPDLGYTENLESTELLMAFDKLNDIGQKVAVERVQELTEIPKYQKENEAEPDDN